ncbi:MAG: PAS domain-containing protein [Synechococcaceae cyanobacterium SM2_3_1]|nr:PAS domain-containing protein [Synechococcaceae cyanobacterium SM2_3_1]
MSGNRQIPLGLAFTLPFVIQVVGIAGLVGFFAYESGHRSIESLAQQLMAKSGNSIRQNLEAYFQFNQSIANELKSAVQLGVLDWENQLLVEAFFLDQLKIHPSLSGLMISTEFRDFLAVGRIGANQRVIRRRNPQSGELESYSATADGEEISLKEVLPNFDPHNSPPGNPWYPAAQASNLGFWRPVVSLVRGKDFPILMNAFFVPFTDPEGVARGVLSTSSHLDQLGDYLKGLDLGPNGQAFIMDAEGILIATSTGELPFRQLPDPEVLNLLDPMQLQIPALESENAITRAATRWTLQQAISINSPDQAFRSDNQTYFGHITPFRLGDEIQWQIVVIWPQSEFTGEIQANARRTVMLSLLALISTIAVGLWISNDIRISLVSLSRSTQAFTQNNSLDLSVPSSAIAEIETFVQSFRRMITEVKQANQLKATYAQDLQREVQKKTDALREAQRIANVGSWEFDLSTGTSVWSEQLLVMLGLTPESTIPLYPDIFEITVLEDRAIIRQAVDQAIIDGRPYEVEHRIHQPDGTIRFLLSRGEAIINAQGDVVKLVGTAADITEIKEAEQKLEHLNQELNHRVRQRTSALLAQADRERSLRTIIQAIHSSLNFEETLSTLLDETQKILLKTCILVYRFNSDGSAVCINESTSEERSSIDLRNLSQRWLDIFTDKQKDMGIWYQDLLVINDIDLIDVNHSYISLLEKIPAKSYLFSPIQIDEITWGLLAVYDHTAHVWQEWEMNFLQQITVQTAIALRQSQLYCTAQEQVKELERLNSLKDEFIGTVSHELRTPITSIRMAANMLEVRLRQMGMLDSESTSLHKYIRVLNQESQREIGLINDLLELSRLQSSTLQSHPLSVVSLQRLIPILIEPFIIRADAQSIHFTVEINENIPSIISQLNYLERILLELLNNAFKYTPEGETIRMSVKKQSDQIIIEITNSGIEIPLDAQKQIFDKFYRVPTIDPWKYGGTGLGLALVKEMVFGIGGEIQLKSQSNLTTFQVFLPIQPLDDQDPHPHHFTNR